MQGEPMRTQQAAADSPITLDPRWRAVRGRDASVDGRFVYSVKTTGVYCRPSCAARAARAEHVEFHATVEAARRAGFRACKRCKPDLPPLAQRQSELVVELCRLIERSESTPTLAKLAAHAGLSTFHTQRLFKAATGVTPRAFAAAQRARRVQENLQRSPSVGAAMHAAGFQSTGRFYAQTQDLLGMQPAAYRAGGAKETIRFAIGECSLGSILVAATERGVCAILLGDDPQALAQDLERRFPRAELLGGDASFEERVAGAVGLVENPRANSKLPLDIRGTAFQRRVWEALRSIPAGATTTYTRIAERLGAPRSVRAVANACAANPLAVAIPCHRVVRRDGDLAGYRWGVERKRELLEREARR